MVEHMWNYLLDWKLTPLDDVVQQTASINPGLPSEQWLLFFLFTTIGDLWSLQLDPNHESCPCCQCFHAFYIRLLKKSKPKGSSKVYTIATAEGSCLSLVSSKTLPPCWPLPGHSRRAGMPFPGCSSRARVHLLLLHCFGQKKKKKLKPGVPVPGRAQRQPGSCARLDSTKLPVVLAGVIWPAGLCVLMLSGRVTFARGMTNAAGYSAASGVSLQRRASDGLFNLDFKLSIKMHNAHPHSLYTPQLEQKQW